MVGWMSAVVPSPHWHRPAARELNIHPLIGIPNAALAVVTVVLVRVYVVPAVVQYWNTWPEDNGDVHCSRALASRTSWTSTNVKSLRISLSSWPCRVARSCKLRDTPTRSPSCVLRSKRVASWKDEHSEALISGCSATVERESTHLGQQARNVLTSPLTLEVATLYAWWPQPPEPQVGSATSLAMLMLRALVESGPISY